MKILKAVSATLVGVVALGVSAVSWSAEGSLSAEEVEHLYFMREEEKLARDVYLTLYDEWGQIVFANIAQSEQAHTEAIRGLIMTYGLSDPVVDDTVGVFVNRELAELYAELVERGHESLLEALFVGALIEEVDMEDIQFAIDATDEAAVREVYQHLLRGSRNHLRAFVRNIETSGVLYEAQYIDPEIVEEILGTPMERRAP